VENETEEVSICDARLAREKVVLLEGDVSVLIYALASLLDDFGPVLDGDLDVRKGVCNDCGDVTFRSSDLRDM
jgi:hypothetical protein